MGDGTDEGVMVWAMVQMRGNSTGDNTGEG